MTILDKARRIVELNDKFGGPNHYPWRYDIGNPAIREFSGYVCDNAPEIAQALLRCVEALEWYAEETNHYRLVVQDNYQYDVGNQARDVLKEIGE